MFQLISELIILEHVKAEPLSIKRQSLVQCLHELSLVNPLPRTI